MKKFLCLGLAFFMLMTGCISMPETRVETTDSRPQIAIKGAPLNSVLLVDGLRIGMASYYNGNPNILRIEPGTHVISIVSETGALLHKQKVFLESELKTITVLGN